jgi:hypothetical protein
VLVVAVLAPFRGATAVSAAVHSASSPSCHRRRLTWRARPGLGSAGEGDHPNQLNAILYDDRAELTRARIAEDNRLIAVVDKYDDAALAHPRLYSKPLIRGDFSPLIGWDTGQLACVPGGRNLLRHLLS